jgi:glycosyltransferase involved in cell wall biosynthesis
MIGPVPPPFGGVGAMFKAMLESDLDEHFRITVVDTSKKDAREVVSDSSVSLRDGYYFLRSTIDLAWKLLRMRPDLAFLTPVADHSLVREALFVRLARLAGAGVVCQFHARYEGELFVTGAGWARRLLGTLLSPADRVLLLSDGLRRYFNRDLAPGQAGVLSNFIDTAAYRALPVPRPPRSQVTVFFLGRLSEQKGVWDLLHAVAPVVAQAPGTHFVLGGVAEFPAVEREIKSFIVAHELTPHITLLGTITGDAKLRAFAEADIFILPSHLENQPVVLIEAMAAGLPVVSTRVGTIPEMITDGEEGFLMAPRDRETLVQTIRLLVADPALRQAMGERGRERAVGEFDRDVAIGRLVAELEAVHARHRGRSARHSREANSAAGQDPEASS